MVSNRASILGNCYENILAPYESLQTYRALMSTRPELVADIAPVLFFMGYRLMRLKDGIKLKVGETSIIRTEKSYGGTKGLFEVYPVRDGENFIDLFGTTDSVVGNLPLEDATRIAEAVRRCPKESLSKIAEEFFTRQVSC